MAAVAVAVVGFWAGVFSDDGAWPDRPVAGAPLPQDRPVQLVVFGTSLSAPPQVWPDQLAKALSDCRSGQVQVDRVVGPGRGSAWALDQVDRVRAIGPDLVLVEFSINDADLRRGTSLASSLRNHKDLIAQLRQTKPDLPIVLMTMGPAQGLRSAIRPRLRAFYALYDQLGDGLGVGFVNHYARWRALPRAQRGLGEDGLHPDPQRAAEVIVPTMQAYLTQQICAAG